MIIFYISKVKIKFDFSFFAVIALFFCFDYTGYGMYSVISCVLHEMGHLAVMAFVGQSLEGLHFYGAGIKIKADEKTCISLKNQFLVLIGGSTFNLILALIFYMLSDGTSLFMLMFASVNVVIGVFNLMPLGCFDGKRIMKLLLIKWAKAENVDQILRGINIVVISIISAFSIVLLMNGFNFTILVTLGYIILITITGCDG